MTSTEMSDLFDLIQDKKQAPYFTNEEKELFLQRAAIEFVNTLLPDNQGGEINLERDSVVFENIRPLVYSISTTMNGDGAVSMSAINAELVSDSHAGAEPMYIMSVGYKIGAEEYPVIFTRHNDFLRLNRNLFSKPTPTRPRYTLANNGLLVRPINEAAAINITLLKYPIKIVIGSVDCDLPEKTHTDIVATALQMAGIATRDEVMMLVKKQ